MVRREITVGGGGRSFMGEKTASKNARRRGPHNLPRQVPEELTTNIQKKEATRRFGGKVFEEVGTL